MRSPKHNYPSLHLPVSRARVEEELSQLYTEAGLGDTPIVNWPNELTQQHVQDPRRYAQVFPGLGPGLGGEGVPRFEFAEQTRLLPYPHRRGLLAHEVGHALMGPVPHSEAEADQAARDHLGIEIAYDKRWPGKGLQRALNPADRRGRELLRRAKQGDLQAAAEGGKHARRIRSHDLVMDLIDAVIEAHSEEGGGVPFRHPARAVIRELGNDYWHARGAMDDLPPETPIDFVHGPRRPEQNPPQRFRSTPIGRAGLRRAKAIDTGSGRAFPWLPLDVILLWEQEAKRRGLSKVARSSRGFLAQYKKAGGDWKKLPQRWVKKRNNFVKRHLIQALKGDEPLFEDNGRIRPRHMILIMWAYSPAPGSIKQGPREQNPREPAYYYEEFEKLRSSGDLEFGELEDSLIDLAAQPLTNTCKDEIHDYLEHADQPQTIAQIRGGIPVKCSTSMVRKAVRQLVRTGMVTERSGLGMSYLYKAQRLPENTKYYEITERGRQTLIARFVASDRARAERLGEDPEARELAMLQAGPQRDIFRERPPESALTPGQQALTRVQTQQSGPYLVIRAFDIDPFGGEPIELGELVLLKGSGDDRIYGGRSPESYWSVTKLHVSPNAENPTAVVTRLYEEAARLAGQAGRPLASAVHRTDEQSRFWLRQLQKQRAEVGTYRKGDYRTSRVFLRYPPPESLANPIPPIMAPVGNFPRRRIK